MKDLLIGLGLLSTPVAVFVVFGTSGMGLSEDDRPRPVSYAVIDRGLVAFSDTCAGCHGRLADGTAKGPDLVSPRYGRGILSDAQFRRAVRRGIGAMPPAPGVSDRRLERMIAFVRELQHNKGVR